MSENSSGEMSYKMDDTYGRIYSTMTRLLLDLTQENHHHIKVEERTDVAASITTTNATYEAYIPSKDPPSEYPTFYPSDSSK